MNAIQRQFCQSVETCIREHLEQDVDRDNALRLASEEITMSLVRTLMPQAKRRIEVIVAGGLVQDVFGVPDGWDVVIKDYDVDENSADYDEAETDDDGCEFVRTTWTSEQRSKWYDPGGAPLSESQFQQVLFNIGHTWRQPGCRLGGR